MRRWKLQLFFALASMFIGQSESTYSQERVVAAPTEQDVVYRTIGEQSLKLDIYLPSNANFKPAPLIVWIHGGAWRSGSKSNPPILSMRDQGFAIASVDYRLSTVAKFPAQAQDIHESICFLKDHCVRFSLDPNRVVIAGASAGGHLALLVGVSSEVKELHHDRMDARSDSKVHAIVSFYGASNLQTILSQSTPHGLSVRVPALELLLGGQPDQLPDLARLASPVEHVDRNDPPLWLIHGDQDPQMPINQSHEIEGVYRKQNLECHFTVHHGGKHGGKEFFENDRLAQLAEELRKTLKVPVD